MDATEEPKRLGERPRGRRCSGIGVFLVALAVVAAAPANVHASSINGWVTDEYLATYEGPGGETGSAQLRGIVRDSRVRSGRVLRIALRSDRRPGADGSA